MKIDTSRLVVKIKSLQNTDICKGQEKEILKKDFFICPELFTQFQDENGTHYTFEPGFDFEIYLK